MKMLNFLLLIFVCLLMLIGCSGPGDGDVTVRNFWPEYDHVTGCDIFPGSGGNHNYSFIAGKFNDANTWFSPHTGGDHEIFGDGYLMDHDDIVRFAEEHGEWNEDTTRLIHKLYLAGVHNSAISDELGASVNSGNSGKAIVILFKETIYDCNFPGHSDEEAMQAVVMHELGHGYGNLRHLCSDIPGNEDVMNSDHDAPTSMHSCIMSNKFPKADCIDPNPPPNGDASALTYRSYCDKCKDKLKKLSW